MSPPVLAASCALLLCGCTGGDAPEGAVEGVVLGTAEFVTESTEYVYRPLPVDMPSVELISGAQGGWHVWGAAEIYGDPFGEALVYEVIDPETDVPIGFGTSYEIGEAHLTQVDDHWVRAGDLVVFDIAHPDEVVGRTLLLRVEIATVADERTVTVVDTIDELEGSR